MTAVVARRTAWAFLVAALVLGFLDNCPGLGPRQWERTADPARAVVPSSEYRAPAPLGPGARLVRGQILDHRGGTP